jgi:hypothetical protein
MGMSIYLTAFSTSVPTAVLAMYDPPHGLHKAANTEWAYYQRQMRDPKNSAIRRLK